MPQNSVTGEHMWTGGGNDVSAAPLAIATGGTITPGPNYIVRLAPAAAVTGVILAPGQWQGQECCIVNESVAANTITFAAAPGGGVADGAAVNLAGLLARALVWNAAMGLWYREN